MGKNPEGKGTAEVKKPKIGKRLQNQITMLQALGQLTKGKSMVDVKRLHDLGEKQGLTKGQVDNALYALWEAKIASFSSTGDGEYDYSFALAPQAREILKNEDWPKLAEMTKEDLEKTYYKPVARWLERHFLCFKTAVNKGLRYGRIDVIGIRDIGGNLSGEVETIAVEVKRGATPFANACGQTLGYSIYANRVYLADLREKRFTQDEALIASNLGIGLIQIKGTKCAEVLSSPFYRPIPKMQLALFENLSLGKCQLCGSVFEIGTREGSTDYSKVARENIKRAIEEEKGLMFWNREMAERKQRLGIRGSKEDTTTRERRFLCPDCVRAVFAQLHGNGE